MPHHTPFKSFVWLLSDRFLKVAGGAVVGLLMARLLGPEDFGRFAVALSLGSFGKEIVGLAMDRMIQRDLGAGKLSPGTVIGTYLGMCLTTALLVGFTLSLVAYFSIEDGLTRYMAYILAWVALPQALGGAELWFISQSNPRPVVVMRNVYWFLFLILRLAVLFTHSPVQWLAWLAILDAAATYLVGWYLYIRHQPGGAGFRFDGRLALTYLCEGWPVILAIVVSVGVDRIQPLMVQAIAGASAAGHFGAALRLTETWWQVSGVAAMAFMPRMVEAQAKGEQALRESFQFFVDAIMAATLFVAMVGTVLAPFLLPVLLGEKYLPAISPLVWLLWAAPAVFVALARFQLFTLQRKLIWELPSSLFAASFLLLMTPPLTLRLGATGTALSVFAGLWISTFLLPLLFGPTRGPTLQIWSSLFFFRRWSSLRPVLNALYSRFRTKR